MTLEKLLYNVKLKIEEGSIASFKDLIGSKGDYIIPTYTDLLEYKTILQEEINNKIQGYKSCLSKDQIDCLKDSILKLVGVNCKESSRDLKVDTSNKNKWIAKHPQCVTYDEWEKWSYYICGKLNIDFKVEKTNCDFTLELTRQIIPCDILVYVQAVKKSCELGIKLDIAKERCQSELKILVDEVRCDLTLNTYIELKKCNVSFDMIKKVYDCNLKLNINSKKEPILVTDLNEYALDCINPLNLEPLLEINQRPMVSLQNILENYK